jgi:hypothetical protein
LGMGEIPDIGDAGWPATTYGGDKADGKTNP